MAEGITDHIWSLKELLTLEFLFNNLGTRTKIKTYENAGHSLKEVSDEVYIEVKSWIIDKSK
jgi:hypothetical protein